MCEYKWVLVRPPASIVWRTYQQAESCLPVAPHIRPVYFQSEFLTENIPAAAKCPFTKTAPQNIDRQLSAELYWYDRVYIYWYFLESETRCIFGWSNLEASVIEVPITANWNQWAMITSYIQATTTLLNECKSLRNSKRFYHFRLEQIRFIGRTLCNRCTPLAERSKDRMCYASWSSLLLVRPLVFLQEHPNRKTDISYSEVHRVASWY